MNEHIFWQLIENAKEDNDYQTVILEMKLISLSENEIVEFDKILYKKMVAAFHWDLWAAAYIMKETKDESVLVLIAMECTRLPDLPATRK